MTSNALKEFLSQKEKERKKGKSLTRHTVGCGLEVLSSVDEVTFGSHPALLFENPWGCGVGRGVKYNRMTSFITRLQLRSESSTQQGILPARDKFHANPKADPLRQ